MRLLRQVGTILCLLFGILGLLTLLSVRIPVHSGPAPGPISNGDVDCDGVLTITDPIRILNHLFSNGPAPCAIAQGDPSCCENLTDIFERLTVPSGRALRASTTPCGELGRYLDNGDGTVTDTCTGLMWQQTLVSGVFLHEEALQVAGSNELGGYTDWRVPTAGEAETLLRFISEKPYSMTHVPGFTLDFGDNSKRYWTSTTLAPDKAFMVRLYPLEPELSVQSRIGGGDLLLVRGSAAE